MADLKTPVDAEKTREAVRDRYAAAAKAAGEEVCCGPASCCGRDAAAGFGSGLYDREARAAVPDSALAASLGCGNPTAVADLHDGDVVLDLGSGAGADVLLAACRVGPGGKVYGLDMTDEMLELARENAHKAGIENVEWLKGHIEEIPLPDETIDVVISNCVINLAADKGEVLREAARVLRPGGRLAVTDVVADEDLDEATREDLQQWTGCIAGALTRQQFAATLADAGLTEIEIEETHRVHESAGSATIRARKPGRAGSEP